MIFFSSVAIFALNGLFAVALPGIERLEDDLRVGRLVVLAKGGAEEVGCVSEAGYLIRNGNQRDLAPEEANRVPKDGCGKFKVERIRGISRVIEYSRSNGAETNVKYCDLMPKADIQTDSTLFIICLTTARPTSILVWSMMENRFLFNEYTNSVGFTIFDDGQKELLGSTLNGEYNIYWDLSASKGKNFY
ncbi:MAG: hypothetical protein M1829_006402 [Trizodia sp. TS-e1964]|nr:MAG: hypothetical protein M1829_006402 [Trizodia sp. TS-e1964]